MRKKPLESEQVIKKMFQESRRNVVETAIDNSKIPGPYRRKRPPSKSSGVTIDSLFTDPVTGKTQCERQKEAFAKTYQLQKDLTDAINKLEEVHKHGDDEWDATETVLAVWEKCGRRIP